MSTPPLNWLVALAKHHEGFRSKIYVDTTGNRTIGYGINLEQGITEPEAAVILTMRLTPLAGLWEGIPNLSPERKVVLVDMAYNLGVSKLMEFQKMFDAIQNENYEDAALEMLDSEWARQTGTRATEDAEIMRTSVMPVEVTT